jgi:HlyD family secretion protein
MRFLIFCLMSILASCSPAEDKGLHGYVEGEYVYVAPTTAGILEALSVVRGKQVEKGDALFSLDKTNLNASRLSAIADIEKAKANLEASENEYTRAQTLSPSGSVSQSESDARRDAYESAAATVKSLEQKLIQIEKQVAEASPLSPAAGRIEDTFFRPGEFVGAGTPVVSMLPPENVKVRFFVPQAELPLYKLGAPVQIKCDGCGKPIAAKISFIASKSEYTPPVIYSVGSRDKLVFMVEAKPDAFDTRLRPGLPVDILNGAP